VDLLPEDEWFARIDNHRTDFYLFNEWAISLDAAEILREYSSGPSVTGARRGHGAGATGYASLAFDALLAQIETAMVTYAREALMEQAWRMLLDDVVAVPLFRPMAVWAMKENLELPISPSGVAFFREARLVGAAH
jgi:ABC-type oligopeptide transport system substrate-binding subunit